MVKKTSFFSPLLGRGVDLNHLPRFVHTRVALISDTVGVVFHWKFDLWKAIFNNFSGRYRIHDPVSFILNVKCLRGPIFFFFFRILRQSLPLKSTEFDLSRYKFLVFNAVLYSVPLTCMCASTVKLFCLLARYTYVPYDARRIHINWVYGWELACSFFSLQVQSLRFERRSGRLTPDTTMIVLSDMLLGCNPRVLPKCIVFNANTPSALNLTREHAECAVCLYRRFVSVVRL